VILGLALVFFSVALANALFWPRLRAARQLADGGLSVLVPARNEEGNLGACLASILGQGSTVNEVLVYDDHSTDLTGAIAASTGDSRVRVLAPVPLPAGWFGKTFACAQLSAASRNRWLLFLDADARLEPDACARMLSEVQRRNLTFLSCWPKVEMFSWAEKLLMPMLNFVVFSIFPAPLSLFRSEPSLGLAHGACMLVERSAYARVGGHTAVRGEIFEDTRMAQIWRKADERGLCLDGAGVVRVRMYSTAQEIWAGFSKNFYLAFRHPVNFWLFLLLHFSVFVLPFLGWSWRAAAVVWLTRAVLALRFGQGWWSVLAHPFAEVVVIAMGVESWRLSRSREGVSWKGRRYPLPRA
jgi:glycosyltransferase involved in cell wall biosynthesis